MPEFVNDVKEAVVSAFAVGQLDFLLAGVRHFRRHVVVVIFPCGRSDQRNEFKKMCELKMFSDNLKFSSVVIKGDKLLEIRRNQKPKK